MQHPLFVQRQEQPEREAFNAQSVLIKHKQAGEGKNIEHFGKSPLATVSSTSNRNLINNNEMIPTLMKKTEDDSLIS